MLYFLDTSSLAKLYVQEPGTERLLRLFSERNSRFAVLTVAAVELRSAIRRRERAGDIDPEDAGSILESFQTHLESRFIQQGVNDTVIDTALEVIDRYALRAYDAIQLAGSLVLSTLDMRSLTFVCSDHRLLEAAQSEQLQVIDPAV